MNSTARLRFRTLWKLLMTASLWALPGTAATPTPTPSIGTEESPSASCLRGLEALPGPKDLTLLQLLCTRAERLPRCRSAEGRTVSHVDWQGAPNARRILVLALIHGDEGPSGSVARSWMERLETIKARNSWRIVPILNPDGYQRKTRMNSRGVDINRNFPTADWDTEAQKHWRLKAKSDPRRDPGKGAGSEPETQCALDQIESFRPDLVISLHTPYGLLDFDGPKEKLPKAVVLPWRFLGHYPGSLGRYLWHDHGVPVVTVELKDSGVIEALDRFDAIQDLAGSIAARLPTRAAKSGTP